MPLFSPPRFRSLQELPPASARFCLAVESFLHKEQGLRLKGARVVTAFSGGADSTALLLTLYYLAAKMGFTLFACHLNHGLREEADDEANACAHFCRSLGVGCLHGASNVSTSRKTQGCGMEEAARNERYAFYRQALAHFTADWIAVGHTNNDLAEDVLMRLIRGAGWPGLSGMQACDTQRRLVRPLLLHSRTAIESFLYTLGVSWHTDHSNFDPAYTRNRIRHTFMPLFLQENPNFLEAIQGLWRLGRLDAAYFEDCVPEPVADADAAGRFAPEHLAEKKLLLPRSMLCALAKPLRLRLYKKALDRLAPGQALLGSLLRLDRAWERVMQKQANKTGRHQFPGAKTAIVRTAGILFILDTQKTKR